VEFLRFEIGDGLAVSVKGDKVQRDRFRFSNRSRWKKPEKDLELTDDCAAA